MAKEGRSWTDGWDDAESIGSVWLGLAGFTAKTEAPWKWCGVGDGIWACGLVTAAATGKSGQSSTVWLGMGRGDLCGVVGLRRRSSDAIDN
ncbi:hypothetical protein M0R45_008588 [Rubus argutus]|uniref:Uncharacterized protein n=1 Tax=Rubus argutus TaxID=59490 RepID=A0AAW1Y2H7_RUBAR